MQIQLLPQRVSGWAAQRTPVQKLRPGRGGMAPRAEPDDAEEPAAAEEAPPATPRGEKGVEEEEEEAEAEEPSSPAGDEPDSPGAKTEELQPLGPDPLESEANRKTYINFWR